MQDRIFSGVFPCGISYADRQRKVNNDLAPLAFLDFKTLTLRFDKACPAHLRPEIIADAAKIQARRGQEFQTTTCGQTVTLGA